MMVMPFTSRLHLQPPLHALESFQRRRNLFFRNAAGLAQRRRRRRVPHVIFAGQRKLEIRPRLAMCITDHVVRPASNFRFVICQSAPAPAP